jgi:hypothetical protein
MAEAIAEKLASCWLANDGSRIRSMLNAASAAVSCSPLANFTPLRMVNVQVVALSCFQDVASHGTTCSVAGLRCSSWSKMLRYTEYDSVSYWSPGSRLAG